MLLRDAARFPTKKGTPRASRASLRISSFALLPLKDEVGTNDRGLDGVAILGEGGVQMPTASCILTLSSHASLLRAALLRARALVLGTATTVGNERGTRGGRERSANPEAANVSRLGQGLR